MFVSSLKVFQVRRFSQKILTDLHPRLNVWVGPNACGKTTLLESLHILTRGKSFRSSQLQEVAMLNKNEFSIRADLGSPVEEKILFTWSDGKKDLKLNDQKISFSKNPLLGMSVSFVPDDLYLLKGAPEPRRNYLDDLCIHRDPSTDTIFSRWKKIHKQRNAVLKSIREGRSSRDDLLLWTREWVSASLPVYQKRLESIAQLETVLSSIHEKLFKTGNHVEIEYEHGFETMIPSEEEMFNRLARVQEGEIALGYSLVGPHKDDWHLKIDGLKGRVFASQGQIRSLVVCLKVAELELTTKNRNTAPILLLDDIVSEFDDQRAKSLIDFLANYEGQLFVTSPEMAKLAGYHREFSAFKLMDFNSDQDFALEPSEMALKAL